MGLSKSINWLSFYWMTILREVLFFFFFHLQQQPLPGCFFFISLERRNLHLEHRLCKEGLSSAGERPGPSRALS